MMENEKIKRLKNHFIHLLRNDEDIQNEILRIVSGTENAISESKVQKNFLDNNDVAYKTFDELLLINSSLEEKNKNMDAENELLRKQILEYQKKLKEQEQTYSKEISRLQADIGKFEKNRKYLLNNYNKLDKIYSLYLNLDASIQKDLERILSPSGKISDTADLFMAYGVQEGNVIALWDIIAANTLRYEQKYCLDVLCDIFQYFLKLHCSVSFKKTEIFEVEIGIMYDERYHTRTSNSSATGKIKNVILPGFTIGKNIAKKALVVLEER